MQSMTNIYYIYIYLYIYIMVNTKYNIYMLNTNRTQPVQLTRSLTLVCALVVSVSQDLHLTAPRTCPSPESVISQSRLPHRSRCGSMDSWKYKKNINTTVSKKDNQISSSQLALFLHLIPAIVIPTNRQNLMNHIFANTTDIRASPPQSLS